MIRRIEKSEIPMLVDWYLESMQQRLHFFTNSIAESRRENIIDLLTDCVTIVLYDENNLPLIFVAIKDDTIVLSSTNKAISNEQASLLFIHLKQAFYKLFATVYQQDLLLVNLFKNEGFTILSGRLDAELNEKQFVLYWSL